MDTTDPLERAQALPKGARFFKCALQVNSFNYAATHGQTSPFRDEASYNVALIEALKTEGIEVISLADHYRVKHGRGLRQAAEEAGILVFPGFEAKTKEGVHVLCIFDRARDEETLERFIGACGVLDAKGASPTGTLDFSELLEKGPEWGAVFVAAHVTQPAGGLLAVLTGQSRAEAWRSPHLLACSIPGLLSHAPDNLRPILENKNADYQRPKGRAVAVLNAQDVNGPADLGKPGAWCWIKMSEVSIQGLRQAFLDPESRVRLAGDPAPEDHVELVALAWQGGFLDGVAIRFNENLNVLIGGRGTGKSTVVESIRYVLGLEPLGSDARVAAEGIVKSVLQPGTKISLLVRSPRPDRREYRIERTVPNPPIVRSDTGEVLPYTPRDVVARAEVYGQHEIGELARDKTKRTRLLDRFVDPDAALARRKADTKRELERSRARILEVQREMAQVAERLASLPALEQTLSRYQQAGLEEKLREQTLLIREERALKTAVERLEPFDEHSGALRSNLPIDRAFLAPRAVEELPDKDLLRAADEALSQAEAGIVAAVEQLESRLAAARSALDMTHSQWKARRAAAQETLDKALRSLQASRVDGQEFLSLRQQIEDLQPLRERKATLERETEELDRRRRNLLAEWEDVKRGEYQRLERAATRVTRRLAQRVRVQVDFEGDREPLLQAIRDRGGRVAETVKALKGHQSLSLRELAESIRGGTEALARKYGIRGAQADLLAQGAPDLALRIEELDLPPTTRIELNTAPADQPPEFRDLDELSTGQKATAVLLLLLLESDAPLIVDQPEDDLDNRFVTEGIVPKMREEKLRRQFVFATHNANIPVLGDAEQILGLEVREGRGEIRTELTGSIDSDAVRALVEELLEGGRDAFELRRLKYGF